MPRFIKIWHLKLAELTEEELAQVVGGMAITVRNYVQPRSTAAAEKISNAAGRLAQCTLEMSTSEIVEEELLKVSGGGDAPPAEPVLEPTGAPQGGHSPFVSERPV